MPESSFLPAKREFFRCLNTLDESEDESIVDQGRLESEAFFKNASNKSHMRVLGNREDLNQGTRGQPTVLPANDLTTLNNQSGRKIVARRVSSLEFGDSKSTPQLNREATDQVKETFTSHSDQQRPIPLKEATTEPLQAPQPPKELVPTMSRSGGKRKRASDIVLVPEAQRIFKDLTFYFFPNSDTSPARRMRIAKALQYGASWVKDWSEGITHIIMDDKMAYEELVKFLKIDVFPANVVVVNEKYPSDCISYRMLVNPKQRYYEIPGYPGASKPVTTLAQKVPSPESSLPLKPPTRGAVAQGSPTPSASGDSANRNHSKLFDETVKEGLAQEFVSSYNDDLTNIIDEARFPQHVPLDLEDDGDSRPSTPQDADSTSESDGHLETSHPSKKPKESWQKTFQCMEKHDGVSTDSNPNASTVEILQQMADFYERVHDQWRTIAYRKAIASLNKQPKRIVYKEEAIKLPFVGERLAAKIEEIALTARLRRLDNAKRDPTDQILQSFMDIYGVGIAQASRWVYAGFSTLDDLVKGAKLTEVQKIGISHYEDFKTRIPRSEVEKHRIFVRKALEKIDEGFEVTVMGSYRRGAESSGDIDLMITKPAADMHYIRSTIIDQLVPQLFSQGFLKAALAQTSKDTGTKWHGCSCLPGSTTWRRIDLLLVPWHEMGAALIYFTGNDIFNRSIRLLASKKGMRLNQRGLYKEALRGKGRAKITDGELLEGRSERRIFDILGVPWRPPEHRIC